jgi:hypothetical protein
VPPSALRRNSPAALPASAKPPVAASAVIESVSRNGGNARQTGFDISLPIVGSSPMTVGGLGAGIPFRATLSSNLMSLLARLVAGAALALALLAQMPIRAAAAPSDYAVAGGWFYTETGGGTGKGFNLLDSGSDSRGQVTRFYSEFNRLGGVTALGYPASNVFTLPDGFMYQATQAALMQWHPGDPPNGAVELANVFDLLSQTGHDKDLLPLGIPPPIPDDGSGGNFQKAM